MRMCIVGFSEVDRIDQLRPPFYRMINRLSGAVNYKVWLYYDLTAKPTSGLWLRDAFWKSREMLESIGIVVKIRNHWNDSFLSFDDSVENKPKVFSSILNPKFYQEWIIIPGLGSLIISAMTYQPLFSVYFRFQTKDVDEKLHHSGKFFIKLHSTTGSKLTKYYLTYDEGKI